jgi:hypothetical protein
MLAAKKIEAPLTESKPFPRKIFMTMFLKTDMFAAAFTFRIPESSSFMTTSFT